MNERFENFTTLIANIHKEIAHLKSKKMKQYGLKGCDCMCLYYLDQHPEGITASELARMIENDRAAISRSLTRLENDACVVVEKTPASKYRAKVFLTDKAKRILDDINATIDKVMCQATQGISEAQRNKMMHTLTSIYTQLQAIED